MVQLAFSSSAVVGAPAGRKKSKRDINYDTEFEAWARCLNENTETGVYD